MAACTINCTFTTQQSERRSVLYFVSKEF